MATLAGECEEALVAAVGALQAGESGGEVSAAEEGLDGGDGGGAERSEGLPVVFLVVGEEVGPAVLDELPEGRGAGVAWLVDGGHQEVFIRTLPVEIKTRPEVSLALMVRSPGFLGWMGN
jgi:hypothetical protein